MKFQEWMKVVWEYCQEHWIAVGTAAVVVLILLLSIRLVYLARQDQEPEEEKPEGKTSEEKLPEDEKLPMAHETPSLVEQILKSAEEAGNLSGQKVESIELKIEKAQLKIRYAGETEGKAAAVEIRMPEEMKAEEEMKAAEEADLQADSENMAEKAADEIPVRKFSPENMNRSRSGRIYTEEELKEKIKD